MTSSCTSPDVAHQSYGAQVENIFNITGAGFPGATVKASTFDAFVSELLEASDTVQLPVVAEEIGDTWIYGD